MTKYIIFGSANDGELDSNNNVYSNARSGSGSVSPFTGASFFDVGQQRASQYVCVEAFLEFDTSAVPTTDVIGAANMLMKYKNNQGWSPYNPYGNSIKVFPVNWTPPLDASDWVPGNTLNNSTPVGKCSTPEVDNLQIQIPIDTSVAGAITAGGFSRYVLATDALVSGEIQSSSSMVTIYAQESGSNGPVLLVYTFKPTKALASGRAAGQLSGGQTVELRGNTTVGSAPLEIGYYDKFTNTYHQIKADISPYVSFRNFTSSGTPGNNNSPELVAMLVDKYDNIFLIGPSQSSGYASLVIAVMKSSGAGSLTWANPVIMRNLPVNAAPKSAVAADFFKSPVGRTNASIPSNVQFDQCLVIHTMDVPASSSDTVAFVSRIQILDVYMLWYNYQNGGGFNPLIIDQVAPTSLPSGQFVGQPKIDVSGFGRASSSTPFDFVGSGSQWVYSCLYESGAGGLVTLFSTVFTLATPSGIYRLSNSTPFTDNHPTIPLTLAADSKVKILSTSQTTAVIVAGVKGAQPVAITVDTNGNFIERGSSAISTIPDSTQGGAWDAIYEIVNDTVWIYFADTGTAGQISKVPFRCVTSVWDDIHSAIVTSASYTTGTTTWLKLAKRIVDERTVHVIVENNNAGTIAQQTFADAVTAIPNAPIITAIPTFDKINAQTVTWAPSFPNPRDVQAKYEFEVYRNDTSASEWLPGVVTSGVAQTTIPANQLVQNIVHKARVRVYNEQNVAGVWSAYVTFSTTDIGSATVDVPVDDFQAGNSASLPMTISYHTGSGATISKYRVKVIRISDSAVLVDTGEVAGSGLSVSPTIGPIPSDTPVRLDVYIVNSAAQTTGTVSRLWNTSYLSPDQITNLSAAVNGSQVDLTWSVPAPTGSRTTPDTIAIYRADDSNSLFELIGRVFGSVQAFTDFIPAANTSPIYYVISEIATGTTVSNQASPGLVAFFGTIINKSNSDQTNPWDDPISLYFGGAGTTEHRADASTKLQFQGRVGSVTEFGQNRDHTISTKLTIAFLGNPVNGIADTNLTDLGTILARLRDLSDSHDMVCFRDGRGRKVFGNFATFDITDSDVGSDISIEIGEADYTESSF